MTHPESAGPDLRHSEPGIRSLRVAVAGRLRVAIIGASDGITTAVLAADHALGREFHQDKTDCRAARVQLLGELPLRRQPPSRPKLTSRNQLSDGALHALCFGALHPWPGHGG
jgi:hypothetical protein